MWYLDFYGELSGSGKGLKEYVNFGGLPVMITEDMLLSRGLCSETVYSRCNAAPKTSIHALSDCPLV